MTEALRAPGPVLRLVVLPEPTGRVDAPTSAGRPARFTAILESTCEFVVLSDQPLVDGARELLERGFDPGTLLTMRHQGKAYDSFEPLPIGEWAKMTYSEGEKGDLKRRRWRPRPAEMPIPADTEGKKQGSEPSGGVRGHPMRNSSAPRGGVTSPAATHSPVACRRFLFSRN